MIRILFALVLMSLAALSQASEHQKIDTLGVSAKGQFVALEEYGYMVGEHSYYVRIKILNVWKEEYVGSPIEVVLPAHRPHDLVKARAQAKVLAQGQLKKFNING